MPVQSAANAIVSGAREAVLAQAAECAAAAPLKALSLVASLTDDPRAAKLLAEIHAQLGAQQAQDTIETLAGYREALFDAIERDRAVLAETA